MYYKQPNVVTARGLRWHASSELNILRKPVWTKTARGSARFSRKRRLLGNWTRPTKLFDCGLERPRRRAAKSRKRQVGVGRADARRFLPRGAPCCREAAALLASEQSGRRLHLREHPCRLIMSAVVLATLPYCRRARSQWSRYSVVIAHRYLSNRATTWTSNAPPNARQHPQQSAAPARSIATVLSLTEWCSQWPLRFHGGGAMGGGAGGPWPLQ